ncbi:hypothetical protein AMTRI_Chr03g143900 [Amborella trichopoda]|uniref:cysteine-rich repeat secretory protein 15 n=1 Tax=Amborella trichopoda TaxID=13333 RepID=UPI0005D417E8|nr:cysteine-rich repeat secretory protein 15 [Amborella trichopoda]|eukprot:XP_006878582.2 cysteine-rich repeat secretory protein 15 [Amborella trichopoda]
MLSKPTPNPNPLPLPLFSLIIFSILSLGFQSSSAYTFIYGGCSQARYQPGSTYQSNLNSLMTSLANSASSSLYKTFTSGSSSDTVYGLYQCRGDLGTADCGRCVQNAASQLGLVCPNAFAAGLQLDACFLRYENTNFIGKLDTTLVYKKCSKSSSGDSEFLERREDVFGAVMAGGGGFRVGGSGLVQGVGQCVGDLATGDCAACLETAVTTLRNVCGAALAGDSYLAQCYVRYWASGYYSHSSPGSSSEDDVGRTVAIIIGVLAGVALLVVVLSFLRKAAS